MVKSIIKFRDILITIIAIAIIIITYIYVRRLADNTEEQLCNSRLRRIALYINVYYANIVPPVLLCDDNGKPVHSWRSMIAVVGQFCEGHRCSINFNKSWNDKDNKLQDDVLADQVQCPKEKIHSIIGSYVAVVGKDTMWPGQECVEIPDNIHSDTILIIEVPEAKIPWMEPRDVTLEELWQLIRSPTGEGITCTHPKGRPYLAVDGTVHYLPSNTDYATLKQLLKRDPRCKVIQCDHQMFIKWFVTGHGG
jgi:hypothetical protein